MESSELCLAESRGSVDETPSTNAETASKLKHLLSVFNPNNITPKGAVGSRCCPSFLLSELILMLPCGCGQGEAAVNHLKGIQSALVRAGVQRRGRLPPSPMVGNHRADERRGRKRRL